MAISALAIAVVVFVAIGIAVEIVFLPKASAPATSSTTTSAGSTSVYCSSNCPTPTTPLKSAVTQWVADFNTRDVTSLTNFYAQDAFVSWTGGGSAGAGLDGNYNGLGNIKILYGSSIGKTIYLTQA